MTATVCKFYFAFYVLTTVKCYFALYVLTNNSKCLCKTVMHQTWKSFNTKFYHPVTQLFFDQNCFKGLKCSKLVKKNIQIWKAPSWVIRKSCFQRQPRTNYLKKTLDFMWKNLLREKLISRLFTSIDKIFILLRRLGIDLCNSMQSGEFPKIA